MSVHQIDPLRDPRWAELVETHPRASVFHSPGWLEALRRTYGYRPVAYTLDSPGTALTSAVVCCEVESRITGRRLVSLPFTDHCEPLVQGEEDLGRVVRALEAECAGGPWRYVEMRPRAAWPLSSAGMGQTARYHLHMIDLGAESDEIFGRFHKDCVQRKIRRAEREQLVCEEGQGEELLDRFYRLLLRTRRRQRLPPQPRAWFRNILDCLGEGARIWVASKDGEAIASILTLSFRDVIVYKYACSDERRHNLGGMHLLLWNAILDGKKRGARELDLGRSDRGNQGLVAFKERWGAAGSSLTYWRYPAPRASAEKAAWGTRMALKTLAHLPDGVSVAAGRILYRHVG